MSRKSNILEHFTRISKGKLYKFFRNGEEVYKPVEIPQYPRKTKFEKFSGWFFSAIIFISCVNGLFTNTEVFLIFFSIGIILGLLWFLIYE